MAPPRGDVERLRELLVKASLRLPLHLVEERHELRVYPDFHGGIGGVTLSIGSQALAFKAPRSGSHRGQTMVYREFSETDRAIAELFVAAVNALPGLLDARAAEGPHELTDDDRRLLTYVNKTPALLSILYDLNLMPEQVLRDPVGWDRMHLAATVFRRAASEERSDDAPPSARPRASVPPSTSP